MFHRIIAWVVVSLVTGGVAIADDSRFGKPVNGLAIGLHLDRSTIRPGKRVLGHVLLRNTTDKPIRVMRPRRGLFGWNITADGRSRKLPASEKASSWQPDPAKALVVPPRQTVLLMSRRLEAAFDLAADGDYSVQHKLSLTRAHLGKGAAADKLWASILAAGVWTGTAEAAPGGLKVDPKAPIAGESRSKTVPLVAVGDSGLWIDQLSGDSSLYAGQVVEAAGKGRLRVAYKQARRWLLTPVPPLKASALRLGDKVKMEEEDHYWMRSAKVPAKGLPMGGLELVLEMDAKKLAVGASWTGKLRLRNTGKQAVHVSILGTLLTNLHTAAGKPPEITTCMGRGVRAGRREIDASRKEIKPGASILLLELKNPGRHAALGGIIGSNALGWKIGPGRYELSFKYWMSLESAAGMGLKPVFTGAVHSNVVEMVVE